eukprot:TRINITY_DN44467_c0_g1_i1.p1 TRINITY_DN44467_c0_g1~~TRINITY_DN44467_c0_g1_i1.p1  ORF type:complete len:345 (+),score=64.04 TRINITY_DN44467_c0_g1_i1:207-1241(+)
MAFSFGGSIRTMPGRQSWADLADTSNESIHPCQFGALPLAEDSYREVCQRDVEESSALSQRLLVDTKLDISTDNVSAQHPSSEANPNDTHLFDVPSESTKTTKMPWRAPSLSEAALALRAGSTTSSAAAVGADTGDGTARRRRLLRKRRPSTQAGAQTTLGKRQKAVPSMVGCDALAALERVFDPNWRGDCLTSAPFRVRSRAGTPSCVGEKLAKSGAQNDTATITAEAAAVTVAVAARVAALPEATEEDWKRRVAKRHGAVASTKATPEYVAHSERTLQAGNADAREFAAIPRTPDAEDRGVSKRKWEDDIRRWRAALRLAYPKADATEGDQQHEKDAAMRTD